MKSIRMDEIVFDLIGSTIPQGESNGDARRLENLKELTELTRQLIHHIDTLTPNADRHEHSMKVIGQHAKAFIQEIHEEYAP